MLGVGLAVDAFIIALGNGVNCIGGKRGCAAATLLAVFQFAAVISGWAVVHAAYAQYDGIRIVFSWAAAVVFLYMSVKMFISAARKDGEKSTAKQGVAAVILQSAAASVDALTVGFTVEEYGAVAAIVCSAIIAAVTFIVYLSGHFLGKRFGVKLGKGASIIGGLAFIAIAVEIIVSTYL
ncbi:MAG: manganese efflux pump MntP family protein [Clostridiales bacterium]|nr:manganese efflux pump MntP family protein [Clostridiales bacterium]